MIGICPHCKIRLKDPPFKNRETNEVMIVMRYRNMIDNNLQLKSIEEIGYCVVCNARLEDLRDQSRLLVRV